MRYNTKSAQTRADNNRREQIARLHKLDRTHYDTPGSVRDCACESCNTVRRIYSVSEKRWD